MAGEYHRSLGHKLFNVITNTPPIIVFFKHMRWCQYLKHQRGLYNKMLFVFHHYLYQAYAQKLGFSIGYDVFGYGLHIPHYGTIVVNRQCEIGNYAVLHTSICIGGAGKIIGDGLYVGTGAKIVGPIHLGNRVSVASQSLVNKSCNEDNVLLAGVPATVKKKRRIWYEEDGGIYIERVKLVEQLKHNYGL